MSNYWQYYKLAYDPFMSEQANKTPYISLKWEQQLDLLIHLASNEPMMQVVTGLTGVGKSTLLKYVINQLGKSVGVCKVHGGSTITPDILQELLARHLGFSAKPNTDEKEFKVNLSVQILAMREKLQVFYLVVDNAHKLPKSTLALLLNIVKWQEDGEHPIRIIVFGGPQLEAMISDITAEHMGEHLTHTIHLEPLNFEEMKAYIMHCWQEAGGADVCPFTNAELEKLYQTSEGVPAKINTAAAQLLIEKTSAKNRSSNKQSSSLVAAKAILAVGLVIVLGMVIYKFYPNILGKKQQMATQSLKIIPPTKPVQIVQAKTTQIGLLPTQTTAQVNGPKPIPVTTTTQTSAHEILNENEEDIMPTVAPSVQRTPALVQNEMQTTPVPAIKTPTVKPAQTTVPPVPALAPKTTPAQAPAPSSVPMPQTTEIKEPVAAPKAMTMEVTEDEILKNKPLTETQKSPDRKHEGPSANEIERKIAAHKRHQAVAYDNIAEDYTSPARKIGKKKAMRMAALPQPSKTLKGRAGRSGLDERYILSVNKNYYALQLEGTHNLRKLELQYRNAPGAHNIHFFKTTLNGEPWYVSIYGQYPSAAAAKNAAQSLPIVLQINNPWPRKYANIQQAIRENS